MARLLLSLIEEHSFGNATDIIGRDEVVGQLYRRADHRLEPSASSRDQHQIRQPSSQAQFSASTNESLTYRSPLRRTRISIKLEDFEPEDIPPAFPQRLQTNMAAHGQTVCGFTLWRGCVEVALELCQADDSYSGLSTSGRDGCWEHLAMTGDEAADCQRSDAVVLEALLASCQVHFKAGQKVWAQVEDRQYVIMCCAGGTNSTWTFQLQQQQQHCDASSSSSSPTTPAMRVDSSRLLYVAPMCILLDDTLSDAPLQLRVGGRGLTKSADLHFAALVGGEHLPCAHTVMDCARRASASAFQLDALACSSAPAIDCWVQVEVPPLSRYTQPGLLSLECRDARSATAPLLAGVLPILLLDDAHVAMEVGQLQHEALQYANEGAAAALASLYCLVTDLAQWLEWVGSRLTASSFIDGEAFSPAEMGDVARALLHAALLRGWKHTAARISVGMRNTGVVPADDAMSSEVSRSTQLSLPPIITNGSTLTAGKEASSSDAPINGRDGTRPRRSHDSATSVSSAEGCIVAGGQKESLVGAMLRGFRTAGDELRYVEYVSDAYVTVAQSWLLCCIVLFAVWMSYATVKRVWNYYLIVLFNSAPVLAAAWCCYGAPQRWRTKRELIWLGCVVGRMVSRLLLFIGNAKPSREFMARYGDIVAGVILPQSAEWVRERYAVWFQLVDLAINTAVYRHIGLHDGALLACFCHALLKMAIAMGMNVAMELWTRRSFTQAVQRKRQ